MPKKGQIPEGLQLHAIMLPMDKTNCSQVAQHIQNVQV
jgi:hypothetical protein